MLCRLFSLDKTPKFLDDQGRLLFSFLHNILEGIRHSFNEANDLARWWENKGMQIRERQLPVVEHKFGSVLISMFTHARVEVRGFGQYEGLKLLGYSLPRKVVECLSVWLQDGQHTPKLNTRKEPK